MNISDIWKKLKEIFISQKQVEYSEQIDIQSDEQTEKNEPENLSWKIDDETWKLFEALEEEKIARKKQLEELFNNPQFMEKIDIIMRHNHQTNEYYYHGTALENAEKVATKGLYLRDDKDISVTAVREFDEMGLYAHRDIATEEELFEMEKDSLIEYSRNGGIGEKCVVIIDKPKEVESIVQPVSEADAPEIASEWITNKLLGIVNSVWIVGYVDKVNAEVIANPLYYDYARVAEQLLTVREEIDLISDAVQVTEIQNKISEINEQASIIRRCQSREEQEIETENHDVRI